MLGGLPAGRHVLANLAERRAELVGREIRIHHPHEAARDALLLAQQRAACDLGRQRGEHRLDEDAAEQPLDLVGVDAFGFQSLEDVEEAIRLRRLRLALVRAAATQAMDLLRRVDHLEVSRERANEVARGARRERRQQRLQFRVSARIALAARDRGAARGLDEVEQRLAALLADDLADELAEPVHVLAQRLILLGEDDVGADGAVRWMTFGRLRPRCAKSVVERNCSAGKGSAPDSAAIAAAAFDPGLPMCRVPCRFW